jgi:HlyD family secretion protein
VRRALGILTVFAALLAAAAGVTLGTRHFLEVVETTEAKTIPTTQVRKGKVTITVTARGELQGGNSEVLITPMAGVSEVPIVELKGTGEWVEPGDVVVAFDSTQQEYNLREAEADLEEAREKVAQAEAEAQAVLEEARYAVINATAEVKLAELEVRKNPLLAATLARQNEIALEAARNRLAQAQRDYQHRQETLDAGIAIQRANVNKAQLLAQSQRRIIDGLVLKARHAGYVHVQPNSNGVLYYEGAVLPPFQVGDAARTGQAIALIPDLSTWEVSAYIPELDRGYLNPGQKVTVKPAALAGRELRGRVKVLGATSGYGWNRRSECRVMLEEIDPNLRPGMTAVIEITVETLDGVLWVPSQALFESDGRTYVFVESPEGFVQRDVTLVRRSESQAVITGLEEGDLVALSRPDRPERPADSKSSAMKALTQ